MVHNKRVLADAAPPSLRSGGTAQRRLALIMSMYPYNMRGPSKGSADWDFDSSFRKWILGTIVPLLPTAYAAWIFVTGDARFGSRRSFSPPIELHGWGAILWGVAMLGVALFLHFRCFWGEHDKGEQASIYGQWVSAAIIVLGFAGMLCYVIWGIIR